VKDSKFSNEDFTQHQEKNQEPSDSLQCELDGTAVSIFVVVLVELMEFVNSTNISTNIEMVVLSNVSCHLA